MSDNEQASIDLSVNADAALQTLQELSAAAKATDQDIQNLKQHLVEQVNAQMGAAGIRPQTYQQAQEMLQRMPAADLAAAAPEVVQTQQHIAERSTAINTAVQDVATAPGAANQPMEQLLGDVRQLLAQQQVRQAQATGGAGVPDAGGVSDLARYGIAPSGTGGAPWTASTPALGGSSSPADTTQQERTASVFGDRFAAALTRSAGGMLMGGIHGAGEAAGMGATADLVAGLARPLMALVSAPLAVGAAVVGSALGIGLGVNAQQAHYFGEEQSLAGGVGTTTGATPSSELTTAQQTGWGFMYHEAQSAAAARQLGEAGVNSSQLGAGLADSMALARVGGIGLDRTVGLTSGLMQAGMSGAQVGDYFAKLDQAARLSGVSVARLTDGITHLNQAAGVGQISVNGLAAAQALAGTSVNFAQASAGTVGSTGTGALSQGALLGLTPTQFEQAQRDPAKLMDAYANLARRYDVGSGGVQVAQQALSSAGFDFSGMKGPQADEFTRRLVAQGPGAAQAYEASLVKKENAPGTPGPHNADQLYAAGVAAAGRTTSYLEKGAIASEQIAANMLRADDNAKALADALNKQPLTQQSHRNQAVQDAANRAEVAGNTGSGPGPAAIGYDGGINLGRIGYDASGDKAFGAISERTLLQARDTGLWVGGGPGKGSMIAPQDFVSLEQASHKTGVPLAILLAQAKQEATNTKTGMIDPSLVSADHGYGLGQFTDPGAAVTYLNRASQQLGDGTVTASNWHQAALNPRVAALAMAEYDQATIQGKAAGGRWSAALAEYNGGPHPNAQAQQYGASVYQSAQAVQHQIGITVTVKDTTGRQVGQAQTTHQVTAHGTGHTSHAVDPHRKHVAAQSYGPEGHTPPPPGIPTLPGHLR